MFRADTAGGNRIIPLPARRDHPMAAPAPAVGVSDPQPRSEVSMAIVSPASPAPQSTLRSPASAASAGTDGAGAFKSALRHLAGGVCAITTGRGDDRTGLTVTSLSSLSAEPPTVMFGLNLASSAFPVLRPPQLRRELPHRRAEGDRRSLRRPRWREGPGSLCRGAVERRPLRCPPARRRARRPGLRAGRAHRAPFARHRHRPGARDQARPQRRGPPLLARRLRTAGLDGRGSPHRARPALRLIPSNELSATPAASVGARCAARTEGMRSHRCRLRAGSVSDGRNVRGRSRLE